jgi:glycosyltransferase involved in cell wall biosynthesis
MCRRRSAKVSGSTPMRSWSASWRAPSVTAASSCCSRRRPGCSSASRGRRLLVIGRGTHIQETAVAPAERLGIADRVVFAGYRGEDYIDVLRCADVFTFLVPGSDGGCRALLEATACGIPAVTTRRGALPEIVDDGTTGLLVDETPASLAAGLEALLCDAQRRARFGAAARQRAEAHFGRAALADAVEGLYAELLGR